MASLRLGDFNISKETGFIPSQEPLRRLPAKFSAWDNSADCLKQLISTRKLREEVSKLPHFTVEDLTEGLSGEEEWWRSYVILCYICHAFVWCEGEKGVARSLPKELAVPWYAVSSHLGIAPVMTHSSTVLYNWKRIDEHGPLTGENLAISLSFTGTRDEEWFSIATVLVEMEAAKAIALIPDIYQSMENADEGQLSKDLLSVSQAIQGMEKALSRMRENCRPKAFYREFRQFLSGWKNNDALPNGLVYQGVSDKPMQFAGGNAGQSTSIAALDILLSVQHLGPHGEFLHEQRAHMQKKHREFLEELEKQPKLRDHIKTSSADVIAKYNSCLESLIRFRSEHIRIVALYILSQKKGAGPLKGTGGSGIMDLLKTIRKDVEDNLILL